MDLVVRGRAGDEMDLDAEISSCFAEGCVCCVWKNPIIC